MRREAWITWIERAVDLAALATGAVLWAGAPGARVAITWPMLVVIAGALLLAVGLVRDVARIALAGRPVAGGLLWRAWSAGPPVTPPLGALVLGLAAVAAFGHLTRNVVVVFRQEPAHRNVVFWS